MKKKLQETNGSISDNRSFLKSSENYSLVNDRCFHCILVISLFVVLISLILAVLNPSLDGDSYEYAGVAANLVEQGQLKMNHVGPYHVLGQKIPQPAWSRATLWTFVLAPFHAVFGRSYLTFLIPFLVTLFFLAPSVYIFAREIFGRTVAFYAALTTLLNPRIFHWTISEDPGQPEILLVIISLCAVGFFIRKKSIAAGISAGLAVLTRLTGILFLPLFGLWTILYRQSDIAKKHFWIFALACILVSSPLFIRNRIVFGRFFYSDQSSSVLSGGEQLVNMVKKPSIFDIPFKYRPPEELKKIKKGFTPSQFADFIKYNAKAYFFGYHNGIAWYPGLIEILSPLMIPFIFIGAMLCIREPGKAMMVLFPAVFIGAMVTLRPGYEDRYIFPVIPFCAMIAFHAAEKIAKRIKIINPAALLSIFIIVEVVPAAAVSAISLSSDGFQTRYHELDAVCGWVKAETPKNAVMMTIPFWSPQYLCSRSTVPPVKGGIDMLKTVADKFRVDYFMFTEYWGGDRFPRFSFMAPVIRGKYISLYRLNRNHPEYRSIGSGGNYMGSFDFLSYFWEKRLGDRIDFQPLYSFSKLTGNAASSIALYMMLCAALFFISSLRARFVIYVAYTIAAIVIFFIIVRGLKDVEGHFNNTPPPVSLMQARLFFNQLRKGINIRNIVVVSKKEQKEIVEALSASTKTVINQESSLRERPYEKGTVLFVPVREKSKYISTVKEAGESFKEMKKEKQIYDETAVVLNKKRFHAEQISGGVIGYMP